MMNWKFLLTVTATAIVVSLIWAGRYSVTKSSGGRIFVVDRFTGSVRICSDEECTAVPNSAWTVIKQEKLPGTP